MFKTLVINVVCCCTSGGVSSEGIDNECSWFVGYWLMVGGYGRRVAATDGGWAPPRRKGRTKCREEEREGMDLVVGSMLKDGEIERNSGERWRERKRKRGEMGRGGANFLYWFNKVTVYLQ